MLESQEDDTQFSIIVITQSVFESWLCNGATWGSPSSHAILLAFHVQHASQWKSLSLDAESKGGRSFTFRMLVN